jgi:hypothetical protein
MFLCDFLKSVKLAQHEFYRLYCDPYTRLDDPTFHDFNAIEALINDAVPMSWFSNLNGGEDVVYFAFSFVGHKYLVY